MKTRETKKNRAAAAFAAHAWEYDAWFEDSPVFRLELAALTLLAPTPAHPAVEIGCGTGRFSRAAGVDIGIDPAKECLRITRQRGIKTIRAAAEALPLATASAGAVFFFFSLCFCADQRLALTEGARVLRPHGSMTVAIINRDSPWGEDVMRKKAAGHPLYRYADLLNPDILLRMFEDLGVEVTATVSCLRSKEKDLSATERPVRGIYPAAGCVIISAGKP